jgi:hypothetical protein
MPIRRKTSSKKVRFSREAFRGAARSRDLPPPPMAVKKKKARAPSPRRQPRPTAAARAVEGNSLTSPTPGGFRIHIDTPARDANPIEWDELVARDELASESDYVDRKTGKWKLAKLKKRLQELRGLDVTRSGILSPGGGEPPLSAPATSPLPPFVGRRRRY